MIELPILGLLKDRAMHGYELKKELTGQLGQFWQVSYGSLYPALRRLEKTKAVEQIFPKKEVARRKNIYRVTPAGEKLFAEILAEHAALSDPTKFGLRFAFFRYLSIDARVEILERRRAYLTEKLAEIKAGLRKYRERIDSYTYRLMEHGEDTTRADLEWIDVLIAEEKASAAQVRKPRLEHH